MHHEIDDIHGAMLARYVAGRCSPEEEAEIRAWIAADPSRAELVESLAQTWRLTREPRADWDVDVAWQQLGKRHTIQESTSRRRVITPFLRAAAVVALLVGAAAVWPTISERFFNTSRPVAMREYRTERAQRAEVRLSDGTLVLMSVDSRMRVPEDYGKSVRDVYLEGEALFDVTHDEKRPFRVHAGDVVAEDLGTRFGVRAYPGTAITEVVVAEGEVALGNERLQPGDLAAVAKSGAVRVERGVDVAKRLAWSEGRLVFDDVPLRDVLAELARWYDLDISVTDSALASQRITASFDEERQTEVLSFIASAVDARYEREGRVVTFRAK